METTRDEIMTACSDASIWSKWWKISEQQSVAAKPSDFVFGQIGQRVNMGEHDTYIEEGTREFKDIWTILASK